VKLGWLRLERVHDQHAVKILVGGEILAEQVPAIRGLGRPKDEGIPEREGVAILQGPRSVELCARVRGCEPVKEGTHIVAGPSDREPWLELLRHGDVVLIENLSTQTSRSLVPQP
jgi:hypothetical protein